MSYADVAASGPKQSPEEFRRKCMLLFTCITRALPFSAKRWSAKNTVAVDHDKEEQIWCYERKSFHMDKLAAKHAASFLESVEIRAEFCVQLGSTYTKPHADSVVARAPPVPEVEHSATSTSSLIDVDSPHVSSVPSDFESQSIKTDTQAERIQHEAEDARIKAEQAAKEAKAKALSAKEKAKKKAGLAGRRMKENADNPVVVGNALIVGIGGAALGWFAYKKYTLGEFTWKFAGAVAGAVGLFAAADVYVSGLLFKKYPPKK